MRPASVSVLGLFFLPLTSFAIDGLCGWSEARKMEVLAEVSSHISSDSRLDKWSFSLPVDVKRHTFLRIGEECILAASPDDGSPILLSIIYDHKSGEFLRIQIGIITADGSAHPGQPTKREGRFQGRATCQLARV